MWLRFHLGILIGIFLVAFSALDAYGVYESSFDLNQVSLEVLDTQILYMDDTLGYYPDDADLIKVTVKVTNNEPKYFAVHDKMFRIWAMEANPLKSTPESEVLEQVDSYYTIYDDQLEVNYDAISSRELYEECDIINRTIQDSAEQVFTVCYEVLRSWSGNAVDLDGPRKYFLVMSDTTQGTSCHRTCHKILLSNDQTEPTQIPQWIQNLFDWHSNGLLLDSEFQTTIDYLKEKNILSDDFSKAKEVNTLESKNQLLKEHQMKIAEAQASNLYVSAISFYEFQYIDDFTGVLCKQQNNIVTFSGDYTNDDAFYDAVFFKLELLDADSVVATGLSKIIDVVPGQFRHFEVSTPYSEQFDDCHVVIDSKFPKL